MRNSLAMMNSKTSYTERILHVHMWCILMNSGFCRIYANRTVYHSTSAVVFCITCAYSIVFLGSPLYGCCHSGLNHGSEVEVLTVRNVDQGVGYYTYFLPYLLCFLSPSFFFVSPSFFLLLLTSYGFCPFFLFFPHPRLSSYLPDLHCSWNSSAV